MPPAGRTQRRLTAITGALNLSSHSPPICRAVGAGTQSAGESNRIAVVTGAAMGLGSGLAIGLVQSGWRVCLTDVVSDELQATAAEAAAASTLGNNSVMHKLADVQSLEQMEAVMAAVSARWGGRLDMVIANAAILDARTLEEMPVHAWTRTIGINLTGVFTTFKAAWPHLAASPATRRHLIAVASPAGVRGGAEMTAYTASKHGVEGLVKSLAAEGKSAGIAVNSMQPGMLMKPTTNPENHMIIGRAARAKGPLDPALLQQAFKHGSQDDHEWQNPINLAPAFAWLASQPSDRFQGLRFDAGMILQMLKAGGGSQREQTMEASVRLLSEGNSKVR